MLEVEDDSVAKLKKRYFAMVTELAKYAGYRSHADRETFKEQVKEQLGGESISEMNTYDQVSTKIEELHKLAMDHYDYRFPTDGSIFNFTN